jgi:hypothetical protein
MMEAARTSETSVDNYFTRQYIPEDKSELHTRRREKFKSRTLKMLFLISTTFRADNVFQGNLCLILISVFCTFYFSTRFH